ncbi:hypothetical protein [Candidatus Avelusimicrobium gallicola]|uniref:Autotransporter domain-containing protein n=1 Tax=Candidatus Avelusimicrobium gallicola TaxID=2562704 RepID=A0A1Y4DBY5_9BACT|nr:hypothetical protein [Elusimicrobium sp. An273]OUO56566.1 hypothetical protein B5F75_05070 [Elusimicrobium sp. An273]
MKKLLGLLLAMTMAWPINAAIVDNVDAIGEIEVIGANNNAQKSEANGAASRVMAGLSAELTEDVRANVQFVYNTAWDGAEKGKDLNTYQNQIYLAEANMVLSNLMDRFELTLGRQFYGDEDSALLYFGPRHGYMAALSSPVTSLDAAKLTYADDVKALTLIAGKTTKVLTFDPQTKSNADFYGIDFRMNLTDTVKAQVYGYTYKNNVWNDEFQGFYGAKLSMMPEAGALSVEYARSHSGDRLVKESHDNPYLVKVDGSLNMDAFTPRAAFIYQKGTVSEYGAYAPGLVYGKTFFGNDLTDVLSESRIFNVGLDYNWEKWTLALDGFAFQDRTAQHAATLEADLTATYQHNENVGLFAGIGYAKLSRADFDRSDATVYQAGVNVKF